MLDPTRKRGVPDIMIIADDGRVLFRELKATGGLVQDHQSAFIKRLSDNGQDVGVWTPEDLDSKRIEGELSGATRQGVK